MIEQGLRSAVHLATASDDLSTLAETLDREFLLAAAPPPDMDSSPLDTAAMSAANDQVSQLASGGQPWLNELSASNAMRQSALPLDRKQVGRARNAPAQQLLRSNMEYQQRVEAHVQNAMINKFGNLVSFKNPVMEKLFLLAALVVIIALSKKYVS